MNAALRTTVATALGAFVLTGVLVTSAQAQCASMQPLGPDVLMQKQSWQGDRGFDRSALLRTSEHDEGIVGFWRVVLTSKGNPGIPDGAVLDKGFSQWHSDGTEMLNSSRAPVTQSFCMGVWKKTGPSKYTLNHFAISWDNFSNFVGLGNIREDVVLSHDGSAFSGTFNIEQFDAYGNTIVRLGGVVVGQRIDVHTTVGELI
jgi:hypothetical protein